MITTKGKAIAVHTIVLIAMMALFIFFTISLFWQWITRNRIETTRITCTIKVTNFCHAWSAKNYQEEPYDWDDVQPKGCENLDPPITKPSEETCKGLI